MSMECEKSTSLENLQKALEHLTYLYIELDEKIAREKESIFERLGQYSIKLGEQFDEVNKLFSAFKQGNEKREKALLFVEHIENHLAESDGFKYKLYGHPKVMCKICEKTIDQIAELEGSK